MIKESTDYDSVAYEQLLKQNYARYRQGDERKKSTWYRILWPDHADFTPKSNLYVGRDSSTNYSEGHFPTPHHDYSDHLS